MGTYCTYKNQTQNCRALFITKRKAFATPTVLSIWKEFIYRYRYVWSFQQILLKICKYFNKGSNWTSSSINKVTDALCKLSSKIYTIRAQKFTSPFFVHERCLKKEYCTRNRHSQVYTCYVYILKYLLVVTNVQYVKKNSIKKCCKGPKM